MPLPIEMNPFECEKTIGEFNGTDEAELNYYSPNGSFSYFDRLSFQVQIEKTPTRFNATKPNTVLLYSSINLILMIGQLVLKFQNQDKNFFLMNRKIELTKFAGFWK